MQDKDLYDLLEEFSELREPTEELIWELCRNIDKLHKVLDWYGDGSHLLSTWYDRQETSLCEEAQSEPHWKHLGGEDDYYVETGYRAENVVSDTELPYVILDLLKEK